MGMPSWRGRDRTNHRRSPHPSCRLPLARDGELLSAEEFSQTVKGRIPHGGWAWLGCLAKNRLVFVPV